MDAVPTTTMTLAEFRQEEERYLQGMLDTLGRQFVLKAEQILLKRPFCFKAETAKKVAEGVVLNGEVLMSNADPEDEEDDEANMINDIGQDYSNILMVALLLVQSPMAVEKVGRTLVCDEKAREMQYRNFCKIHPELNQENPKIHKETKTVYDYATLKEFISEFIANHGTRACTMSVAFNGHGSENGLCFEHHKEGDDVPLNQFIADMKEVIGKHRNPYGRPTKVQVIFGQCFAHLHTPSETTDLKIYSFTSAGCKRTFVTDKRDPLSNDVVDSHHIQLENHAQVTSWGTAAPPQNKMATYNTDGGPATSMGGIGEGFGVDVDDDENLGGDFSNLEMND